MIVAQNFSHNKTSLEIKQFAAWGFTFTLLNGKVPLEKGWQAAPHTAEEAVRHRGNKGVLAGAPSRNIAWLDTDTDFPRLLATFPILQNSLISYRDNAPERGKVAIRVVDRCPISAKAHHPGEKQPYAELLSTGNQAAVIGVHPSGAAYRNNGKAPIEMTFAELAAIWRAWTGEELTDTKATKAKRAPATPTDATEQPTERTHTQNTLADQVRQHWTVLDVLRHFGRLGELRSERNGEIRVLGNGGLLIQPKQDIFYSFADERGGDALECWAWCMGLSRTPKGRRFVEMAHDMLRVKGIEIEQPAPAVDLGALCETILTTDLGQFVPDELKAQRNGKAEYRTASTDRLIITRILQIMKSVGRTDNITVNAYRVVRGVNTDGHTVQAKSHKTVEPVLKRHAWLFNAQPTDKPNTWLVSLKKVDVNTFPLVTPVSSGAKGGNLITTTFLHWMNDDQFSGGTSRYQRQNALQSTRDGDDDAFHAYLDKLYPGLQACGILVVDGLLNAGGSGATYDEIAQTFGLNKSLVAAVIRKLRAMGLVESHRQYKAPSIHFIEPGALERLHERRREFRTYNGSLGRWGRTLDRAQTRAEKTACDLSAVGADTSQIEGKIARLAEQRRTVRSQLYPQMSADELNKWAYTPLYVPPAPRKRAPAMPEPTVLAWGRLCELTGKERLTPDEYGELQQLDKVLGAKVGNRHGEVQFDRPSRW